VGHTDPDRICRREVHGSGRVTQRPRVHTGALVRGRSAGPVVIAGQLIVLGSRCCGMNGDHAIHPGVDRVQVVGAAGVDLQRAGPGRREHVPDVRLASLATDRLPVLARTEHRPGIGAGRSRGRGRRVVVGRSGNFDLLGAHVEPRAIVVPGDDGADGRGTAAVEDDQGLGLILVVRIEVREYVFREELRSVGIEAGRTDIPAVSTQVLVGDDGAAVAIGNEIGEALAAGRRRALDEGRQQNAVGGPTTQSRRVEPLSIDIVVARIHGSGWLVAPVGPSHDAPPGAVGIDRGGQSEAVPGVPVASHDARVHDDGSIRSPGPRTARVDALDADLARGRQGPDRGPTDERAARAVGRGVEGSLVAEIVADHRRRGTPRQTCIDALSNDVLRVVRPDHEGPTGAVGDHAHIARQAHAVAQIDAVDAGRRHVAVAIDGRGPRPGEIFRNPGLARTLMMVASGGKTAFYQGLIAEEIVNTIQSAGGCLSQEDLAAHDSTWDQPISTLYRGINIWECPPNGQGLAALLGLNILEGYDLASLPPMSAERLHLVIEALRLAFADSRWYVTDPAFSPAPLEWLLSKDYADERRRLIDPQRANPDQRHGVPVTSSDTVYLTVVDQAGNACSFINSNYMGFGTGIVPSGWGFSLQNRGHNFSLDPHHPNVLAPGKRPYHTIIPAMATYPDGELFASFGVMGGFMQPQGHIQVLTAILDDGQDPQSALDRARLCIEDGTAGGKVALEQGIPQDTVVQLEGMGHHVYPVSGYERALFGRGQIILRDRQSDVLWGGSDPRADGCAMGMS